MAPNLRIASKSTKGKLMRGFSVEACIAQMCKYCLEKKARITKENVERDKSKYKHFVNLVIGGL